MRSAKHGMMAIAAVALLVCGACQRLTDQKAAIEAAIKEHLSRRSDLAMGQMVLEMGEVKVEGDNATAEVVFRTTAEPAMRMAYHYELRRESGAWQVASGRPSAAEAPHPALGEGDGEPSSQVLPEGHPPIPDGSTMPEGHPPAGEPPSGR